MESKQNVAISPRGWVGYALLFPFLFDTFTFLQTNWSRLKVPMYTANELAVGCVLCVAGALSLSGRTLKRTLLRVRIGVALILIAAAVYSLVYVSGRRVELIPPVLNHYCRFIRSACLR